MTTTPARHSCTRGPLISAEGISKGVGKTYLTNRAIEALDDKPLMLDGFSQRANGSARDWAKPCFARWR